ncbi:MAG: glycosyltransferase family 4 protein [Verrucomicrobiota bacterium]
MKDSSKRANFAYVFERFPSFTQTFCAREVESMLRLGVNLEILSIRDTREEKQIDQFPSDLLESVRFLPEEEVLVETVNEWKKNDELPQEAVLTLRHWGREPDKRRIYEAIYVGRTLQQLGVRHAHTHFAGVGARTCWWMEQFFGISYSFTGHANDIFERTDFEVSLEKLVEDAAVVATVSEYTADYLKDRFPRHGLKVHRAYNGIDLESLSAAPSKTKGDLDPPKILSVGRLIEKKGFDDLVTACAMLRDRQIRFQCKIVGDGPLQEELEAAISEYEVGDCVRLVGPKSQEEIKKMLHESSVFALPCVTEKAGGKDNLPTVIMEAMAARLPCVSTKLAGVPEMVEHEVTGFLAEERQPEKIADYLAQLLNDAELAKKMGEAGYARAEKLFSLEKTSTRLLHLLWSRGSVRFDLKLVSQIPSLLPATLRQWMFRFCRRFHRRSPSRFVLAEMEAKRRRKASQVG